MSPRANILVVLALLAGLFYGCFCLPCLLELTRTDEVRIEAELVWPTVPPAPPATLQVIKLPRTKTYLSLVKIVEPPQDSVDPE